MNLVLALIAAAQAAASPAPAAAAPGTAFFCQFRDRSTGSGPVSVRPLHILLSGPTASAGEGEPTETFDPTDLLERGSFSRFLRGDAGAYDFMTGPASGPNTYLLAIIGEEGHRLGAGLGRMRDGPPPRYLGMCLRFQSADIEADFRNFNASLGRQ